MKKSILILAMFAAVANKSNSAVYTVSNLVNSGAQFTAMTVAYTGANNGDTLLVEGSNTVYSMPSSWAKNLTVIGIGFNPEKDAPVTTKLNGLAMNNFGSFSKFYGIEFTGTVNQNSAIGGYKFEDCKFSAGGSYDGSNTINGIVFNNCVFTGYLNFYGGSTYLNVLFTSCIFNSYIYGGNSSINPTGWITMDHCLFFGGGQEIYQIFYGVISNSSFMNSTNPTAGSGGGNIFNNNIYRVYASQLPTAQSGYTNSGSGNLPSTNPNFVSYTLGSSYNQVHDYHLQTGSPAIGTGTGGSDIGLHGSIANFNEKGEVLIVPIVRTLNINNTTVVPNGTLNVQINATKPNDN